MALFDKIKVIGNTIGKTTDALKDTIVTNIAESSTLVNQKNELLKLENEKKSLENEINTGYMQIGKKYVEYVLKTQEMPGIDVMNILKALDPKLSRKNEIDLEIVEIEKKIKDQELLREREKIEKECEEEKEKLDKALKMEIITQNEYNEKLKRIMIKINKFEEFRNIEAQFNMGIISAQEKEEKIKKLIDIC